MGYWVKAHVEVVITHIIGPGPNAKHNLYKFVPDSDYQGIEIAKIYQNTNRTSTYLGDWHTHPLGSSHLSRKDKQTLRKIARSVDARCSAPLMLVLAGGKDSGWHFKAWKYIPRRFRLSLSGIKVELMTPSVY